MNYTRKFHYSNFYDRLAYTSPPYNNDEKACSKWNVVVYERDRRGAQMQNKIVTVHLRIMHLRTEYVIRSYEQMLILFESAFFLLHKYRDTRRNNGAIDFMFSVYVRNTEREMKYINEYQNIAIAR